MVLETWEMYFINPHFSRVVFELSLGPGWSTLVSSMRLREGPEMIHGTSPSILELILVHDSSEVWQVFGNKKCHIQAILVLSHFDYQGFIIESISLLNVSFIPSICWVHCLHQLCQFLSKLIWMKEWIQMEMEDQLTLIGFDTSSLARTFIFSL